MMKRIRELMEGDQVLNRDGSVAYTLLGDASVAMVGNTETLAAPVQWADGGRDIRVWPDGDHQILVAVPHVG